MQAPLSSTGSRRYGVSRGVHVVFAAILCITMVLSCLGAATAQPTMYAGFNRNRDYWTSRDSVRYNESLTGRYTWDIWMGGETATPAAIEVLTKQTFENPDPKPNSTTQEDSEYRYRWDVPDVSKMSRGVWLHSDLEVTFQPGFDSQRTLSPAVLEDQVTIQTLQVKVTPREGSFLGFSVHLWMEETQEARAVLVPDSDRPRLDWQGVQDSGYGGDWWVESPVNGKEYKFSLQLRTENKLYPNKVVYKPYVNIQFQDSQKSSRLTGSTVTVEDDILGKIGFSTPSTSRWQIEQRMQRRVQHEGESAVWGSVGDYATCRSIDQDGNPVERSGDFLTIDEGVTVWVNLYDLRVSVDVKFEWYAPDGSLHREYSITAPSPPEGEEAWNYAVHDSIEVKGKPPSRVLGSISVWKVKISVDGSEPIVAGFRIRRAPSSISVSLSAQTVSQGENLLVTGTLSGPPGGVEITLRYEKPDGSTVKRTVTTMPDGSFNDRYTPDLSGAWTVMASWEGDDDYEGTSTTRNFTMMAGWSFGSYPVFAAAIAVVVTISFVLFWRRRTRRPPVAVEPVAVPPAAKGYCIFCAAPIEPEQEFCMQCGRRQIRIELPRKAPAPVPPYQPPPVTVAPPPPQPSPPVAPAPAQMLCINCGSPIPVTSKFCAKCGSQQTMAFCSNCGKELSAGAGSCPSCGSSVSVAAAPPQRPTMGVSSAWYLLPFFLTFLGGIVAWALTKDRDPAKARKLLIFGFVWFIVIIVIVFLGPVAYYLGWLAGWLARRLA